MEDELRQILIKIAEILHSQDLINEAEQDQMKVIINTNYA